MRLTSWTRYDFLCPVKLEPRTGIEPVLLSLLFLHRLLIAVLHLNTNEMLDNRGKIGGRRTHLAASSIMSYGPKSYQLKS